jgi:hypothetical protein
MTTSMFKMIPSTMHHIHSYYMNDLIKDAEELYDYLLNRIDTMFYPDKTLIFVNLCGFTSETDTHILHNISLQYGEELRLAFGTWLHHEIENNSIFDRENWQIFRKVDLMTHMYLGYRILFIYHHYYFQVSYDFYFFGLVLYGWKEADKEKLQPDNRVNIPDDKYMPEDDWYNSV